jgi:hypothetical protein
VAASEKEKILLGKVNHQQVEILRCRTVLVHLLGARVKDVEVGGDWLIQPRRYPPTVCAIRSLGLRQPIVLATAVEQPLDTSLLNRARRGEQLLEEMATGLLDILEHLVDISLW